MSTQTQTRRNALVEALYRTEGKAEIVDGEVIPFMASGFLPARLFGAGRRAV